MEDWYHGHYPGYDYHLINSDVDRVVEPTTLILDIFDKCNCKATFFVLGVVAKKHPNLIKEIQRRGHEIASHGWDHDLIDSLKGDDLRKWLTKSKTLLQDITGNSVNGFRAPNFSVSQFNISRFIQALEQCEFLYDSSIYPAKHYYGGLPMNQTNYCYLNHSYITEYPVTKGKISALSFPLGGFYLRFLKSKHIENAILRQEMEGKRAVLYFHPKDIDIKNPKLPNAILANFVHQYGIKGAIPKLETILKSFMWGTIASNLTPTTNETQEKTKIYAT